MRRREAAARSASAIIVIWGMRGFPAAISRSERAVLHAA
jgi:hypothetical protein